MARFKKAVTRTGSRRSRFLDSQNSGQKNPSDHGASSGSNRDKPMADDTPIRVVQERGTPDPPQWKDGLHKFLPEADWHDVLRDDYVMGKDVDFSRSDPTIGRERNKESRKQHNRDWSTQMTRFMASSYGLTPALNEGWYAVRPVGIGGEAMVTLWARTLPDGTQEFTAIREIFPNLWNHLGGNTTPLEVRIHRRLSALKKDTESILQLKDYCRYMGRKKHRMWLEWAPYSNLDILIQRYQRWRRYLPEPFLWYLFHKLAKALVILQYGRIDPPEATRDWTQKSEADKSSAPLRYDSMSQKQMFEACKTRGIRIQAKATKDNMKRLLQAYGNSRNQGGDAGAGTDEIAKVRLELQTANWKEIVHRDISPNNILLGEPGKGKWSMYPMPKLADFGMARETYDGDPNNPDKLNWVAHPVWKAPEQRGSDHIQTRVPQTELPQTNLINAQLNVYQISEWKENSNSGYSSALVIAYATGLEWSCVREAKSRILPVDAPYRQPFLRLLKQCLVHKPANRPTPLGLYRITGAALKSCYTSMNGDFDRYRLYYRGNEINDMPTGFHIPRDNGDKRRLFNDEQFPVADTMDDEQARIHPPGVERFYPYETDGRDFFEDDIGDFRKRWIRNEPANMDDHVGFANFVRHRHNRLVVGEDFDSDRFNSSDESGEEAKARYQAKVAQRIADKQVQDPFYKRVDLDAGRQWHSVTDDIEI
ncbi:hypothetical protein MMC11_001765 [Xylographa trunciseda]|nr:hypothetical protein [Xylographa trunciseda]